MSARTTVVVVVALLAVITASCGSDDAAEPEASVTAESVQTTGEIEFPLKEEGAGSAAGARAIVRSKGATKTLVIVEGIEEGAPGGGGANEAHLHHGTCDESAEMAPTYRLKPIRGSSESATVVDVSLAALLSGEWAVDVHLPRERGKGGPPVIACGEVPDATGSEG
jgi:hypothetical protein